MSKFQVGEIAVLACSGRAGDVGDEVEVVDVGPWHPPTDIKSAGQRLWLFAESADYIIETKEGVRWFADEHSLRKRRPPGADIVRDMIKELPREVVA